MNHRLLLWLSLLVLLPLSLLAWLGLRAGRGEQAQVEQRFRETMQAQLRETSGSLQQTGAALRRQMDELLMKPPAESLQAWVARCESEPLVRQAFVLNAQQLLVYPDSPELLSRTVSLRAGQRWQLGEAVPEGPQKVAEVVQGWRSYYHGAGVQFIAWSRMADGSTLALDLATSALLARLIEALPASGNSQTSLRTELLDHAGQSLYQWGYYQPEKGQLPTAEIAAPEPFSAWSLRVYTAPVTGGLRAYAWPLGLGLAAVTLVLAGLAVALWRESSRDARVAAQRITFVNHVSHELKTPLTNISLFAELAEEKLPEDAEDARQCLAVVITESERLGRLITNVLTFSRHQRGSVVPVLTRADLVQIIGTVAERFRPSLAQLGMQLETSLPKALVLQTDADMLEQILSNLLSNAEKYAAGGKWIGISVEERAGQVAVWVRDRGPGVPAASRERIFEPFYRVSHALNDGTAGTGIGLGLARDLARLLGGDLVLASTPEQPGASFLLTLQHHLPTV